MADGDPPPLPPASANSSLFSPPDRDKLLQQGRAKIAELDKYQSEIMDMLQGLRQDIQNWTSEIGTQAKTYQDEISELKRRLGSEVNQMRPSSDTLEIPKEIKEQGKETENKAQVSSNDGMENKISTVRWQMMIGKLKALTARLQD